LGLAIVGQLVESCGGSVCLEDAEPGLRAVVRVPLAVPSDRLPGEQK
jgi:signal transduction histidine kinase